MKLSEHKELKKEILSLPPKEKDKLLLRLVAKDKVLTEHLHFLLLEDSNDLQKRVEDIKTHISGITEDLSGYGKGNAKDTLSALRKLAKHVNHNLRVTKAVFEDVELRIYLFTEISTTFKYKFFGSYKDYEQAFYSYYLRSVVVTLNKYYKLHEDLQFDLKERMNVLLAKIWSSKMASEAQGSGLPREI